jgi:hypothetical protein
MQENENNKIVLKDRLKNLYRRNKLKIYIFFIVLATVPILLTYFKISNDKKNYLIAEKYVQAGLYLASNKKDEARQIYEDIILSKNNIYSILSLNTILEKNLISDKQKIFGYFEIVEKLDLSEETNDIISLKKALYLIKSGDSKKGNDLLKKLLNKNSNLTSIVEELYIK